MHDRGARGRSRQSPAASPGRIEGRRCGSVEQRHRLCPAIDEDPRRYIAIGLDDRGRLIELVVIRKELGVWLIVHAQCPPQHDIKSRLGFGRRK